MEQLLSLLKTIPEYAAMVSSLQDGESVAVTGIGQINRSHMIAGLCRSLNRPMVVLCQDDLAARRLQEELKGFLADTAPILPGRDLTLYDAPWCPEAGSRSVCGSCMILPPGRPACKS